MRSRRTRAVVLAAAVATLACCAPARAATIAGCPDADVAPAVDPVAAEQATLCLVNVARLVHGVPALSFDAKLRAAAIGHSRDMIARRYFSHYSPDGRGPFDRMAAAGYATPRSNWSLLAENLALGGGKIGTPWAIVLAWYRSPEHRANMLDPKLEDVGIGIAVAPDGVDAAYTTDFGARATPVAGSSRTPRSRSARAHGCRTRAGHRALRARSGRATARRAVVCLHG